MTNPVSLIVISLASIHDGVLGLREAASEVEDSLAWRCRHVADQAEEAVEEDFGGTFQ